MICSIYIIIMLHTLSQPEIYHSNKAEWDFHQINKPIDTLERILCYEKGIKSQAERYDNKNNSLKMKIKFVSYNFLDEFGISLDKPSRYIFQVGRISK